MIQSAVTVSLVEEARGGPFVFWDDLPAACRKAKELGFDAVELFAPGPGAVPPAELGGLLKEHQLKLAAVGTGAGWVIHRKSLTAESKVDREAARDFVLQMIDYGGPLGAPAIIGSMQGRWGDGVSREQALDWLREALDELGPRAAAHGVPLIYEPLNRYETNLVNTVADGVALLEGLATDNVKLLADLFHMSIEEADLAAALRAGRSHIGHVHFVDSNRRAAGMGHMSYEPIAATLKDIGYAGYASAEALPLPSSDEAARATIEAFERYLR